MVWKGLVTLGQGHTVATENERMAHSMEADGSPVWETFVVLMCEFLTVSVAPRPSDGGGDHFKYKMAVLVEFSYESGGVLRVFLFLGGLILVRTLLDSTLYRDTWSSLLLYTPFALCFIQTWCIILSL